MQHVILLVDDEPNILYGLARALRDQPYQIFTARSGAEAQLILKSHPVDVIISDEQMPGMRGSDLLTWVADNCGDVARMMLTGRATVETAMRAINDGAVFQFFTKPCNPADLAVSIHRALERRSLLAAHRQLQDVNRQQFRQLQQYGHELETLTRIVARDIHTPLQTALRACQQLEEQYEELFDPRIRTLVVNALESIADVQYLVNNLQQLCHTALSPAGADPRAACEPASDDAPAPAACPG